MPRAGLDPVVITAAAADIADQVGFTNLTMGAIAEQLGVRAPSLYKHVSGQDEVNRRVATLAFEEAGSAIGNAIQGLSGRDALAAAANALRDFAIAHPGRYAATVAVTPTGSDDPMTAAAVRSIAPLEAVLRGYAIDPADTVHAVRALRSVFGGFASLESTGGFRWATDVDDSFDWLIDLVDQGLRARAH
ncbi:TetR/AcrR family transcriptional regulator [Curtobacterium sp. Leaf183]|uniref:TetR/AcrR family transcriptional regulator n=1 Tax=Curtobacterium sp. Leaf183 TaxID=1736291 RepID=UPI000AEC0E3B|nr:TetR-like C-terminal domain-containing protein [Curtobacterium sp. Leaf183]